jgi:hypothetical protein
VDHRLPDGHRASSLASTLYDQLQYNLDVNHCQEKISMEWQLWLPYLDLSLSEEEVEDEARRLWELYRTKEEAVDLERRQVEERRCGNQQ